MVIFKTVSISRQYKCDYHFQHTCGYCGNRFPERRTLVKHERCHTGEKPYACDSCDFRCSSSSSLCQHKRRRHDPTESGRKHICEQCGKGFYTRDNLKVRLIFNNYTFPLILRKIKIDSINFHRVYHLFFFAIVGTYCNALQHKNVFMLHMRERVEKWLLLSAAHGLCSWLKTYLWALWERFLFSYRTKTSSKRSTWNHVLVMLWLDIIGGKLRDVCLNRGNTKYCVQN